MLAAELVAELAVVLAVASAAQELASKLLLLWKRSNGLESEHNQSAF